MAGLLPVDFYNGNLISNGSIKKSSNTPPLLQDYLIDLNTGFPIVSDSGQFVIVEGLEAVVTQIWRKLHIPQGVHEIFSSKYGNTFDELRGYGKSYADAYSAQKLKQAIQDGIYVKSVDNIQLSLEGSNYTIYFTIKTIYGDTSQKLVFPFEDFTD